MTALITRIFRYEVEGTTEELFEVSVWVRDNVPDGVVQCDDNLAGDYRMDATVTMSDEADAAKFQIRFSNEIAAKQAKLVQDEKAARAWAARNAGLTSTVISQTLSASLASMVLGSCPVQKPPVPPADDEDDGEDDTP